jgi:hypothetical protein
MKNFEESYQNLGNYFKNLFLELIAWCKQNDSIFLISGSTIGCEFMAGSDFDFILIVPDIELLNGSNLQLPKMVNSHNWQHFKQQFEMDEVEIFGTFSTADGINRFEIYPYSIAEKILNFEEIKIRRLKHTPLAIKYEIFYNAFGEKKELEIVPVIGNSYIQSTTYSVIHGDSSLFWGMHVERLFLSRTLFDEKEMFIFLKRMFRRLLWEQASHNENELKTIISNSFYLTSKFPNTINFLYGEFIASIKAEEYRSF